MIIVVEGISAAGKSTWCARHGVGQVVLETGRLEGQPGRAESPASTAKFWVDQNVARWRAALAVEAEKDLAICDTDPLKLHYVWSLWQIGEASQEQWNYERAETRQAFLDRRIGFADTYIIGAVDPQIARQRRDGDNTRRRRKFELHVRLQPSLLTWYRTLGSILPCPFFFRFPEYVPSSLTQQTEARYDLKLFDQAMACLPRAPT
jgi:hypothetical protein